MTQQNGSENITECKMLRPILGFRTECFASLSLWDFFCFYFRRWKCWPTRWANWKWCKGNWRNRRNHWAAWTTKANPRRFSSLSPDQYPLAFHRWPQYKWCWMQKGLIIILQNHYIHSHGCVFVSDMWYCFPWHKPDVRYRAAGRHRTSHHWHRHGVLRRKGENNPRTHTVSKTKEKGVQFFGSFFLWWSKAVRPYSQVNKVHQWDNASTNYFLVNISTKHMLSAPELPFTCFSHKMFGRNTHLSHDQLAPSSV